MQPLLRTSWPLDLVFLALCGFLIARIASTAVDSAFEPSELAAPVRAVAALRPPAEAQISLDEAATALGVLLSRREDAREVPTPLQLTLVGTMVGDLPGSSMALLRDAEGKSGTFAVGDHVRDAEIVEIGRLRVLVLRQDRLESVDLATSAAGGVKAPAITTTPGDPEVVCSGEECSVARAEIDRLLASGAALGQARVVPSFVGGSIRGFKIFSIRPGSIYERIGLQNGDVVRTINGYELDRPERTLEIYTRLKEASHVEIEVLRRGETVRKRYRIE